jgi:hypothetical protein
MFDAYARTVEFQLVLGITEAIREELGADIDSHPGGPGNEAGQVNRALRAAARCILRTIVTPRDDLRRVMTWTLRQAALRRLAAAAVLEQFAEALLDSEPGLGDAWLAYVALSSPPVIEDMLDPERRD